MGNRRVVFNVLSSAVQVALIGLIYFFLYKYLLKHLGIELLGVWSVVMATSSLANLANFGVATSVVRYVALYIEEGSLDKINKLIFTSLIFIFGLFVLLSAIILPFADILLRKVVNVNYLNDGLKILPYSVACLILNAVAGVFASVLDGMQKNYLRSIIFTSSAVVLLGITYLMTPRYGLQGVVLAQLAQSVFTIIGCLFLVVNLTAFNPFKWQWNRLIFKEIFSYGIKFQFISLSAMFNEPITKLLLAKYGGLQFTGYYEMASRLIMQLRGVVISANQSLVPLMVSGSKGGKTNASLYRITFLCVSVISLILMFLPVLASGIIAKVWIGHYEYLFDVILFLTAISMYINLLCGPAYFALLAEGKLGPVIISQVIIAVINIIGGFLLGKHYGGIGVVYGWLIAVIVATSYLIIDYSKKVKVSIASIFKKEILFILFQIAILFVLKYSFAKLFVNNIKGESVLVLVAMMIFIINGYFLYKKFRSGNLVI
jgi:O-antigen/teichoic acid export membrane protein